MRLSTTDLAIAREVTAELLEELRLDGYLFEVEPGQDQWSLRIECGAEEGWEMTSVSIAPEDLLAARNDPARRQTLLTDLRNHLASCKTSGS